MNVYIVYMAGGYPNGVAPSARVFYYAQGLAKQGVNCEIIMPIPTERFGQKPLNTIGKGIYKKTPYRYIIGSPLRHKNVFVRKIIDIYGYTKTLFYILTNTKHGDIVFVYGLHHIIFNFLLARLTHLVKTKIVLELCEFPYVTTQKTTTTIRKKTIFFNYIFSIYDGFIVISQSLFELAQKYANQKAKILKVPILVNNESISLTDKKSVQEKYIFHSGTLYEQKDGILGMLRAFALVSKQTNIPLKFYLTGNLSDSPHKDEIKRIIELNSLERKVIFMGYLSKEELNHYQSQCICAIINKYDNQQNNYCFSTKLAEYLSFARPVIITNVGEAMYYLKDNVNAYIVEQGKPELIAEKILDVLKYPEIAQRIGKEGYKLTEKDFNYLYQAKRIRSFFEQITYSN